jgi:hypothetical protein
MQVTGARSFYRLRQSRLFFTHPPPRDQSPGLALSPLRQVFLANVVEPWNALGGGVGVGSSPCSGPQLKTWPPQPLICHPSTPPARVGKIKHWWEGGLSPATLGVQSSLPSPASPRGF